MNTLNDKLVQLWAKRSENITDYIPQFYPEFQKQKTLIVGLNPSFSEKGYRSFLREGRFSHWLRNLNERFSYDYFTTSHPKVEEYIEIEAISKETYTYYKKISQLTSDWQYIDLFHVRVTDQNKIKELIKQKSNFLLEQLEVTLTHIDEIEPKAIVVVNGLASDIIRQKREMIFNNKWGTYSLNGIPIFLSGMLTGPGAIDKGAFRRLQWHYEFVIQQI